jgi:mono/diheme cytochrome c family protein
MKAQGINAMPTLGILGAAFLASFLGLTSLCLAAAQKVKVKEDAYAPGKKDVYAELAKVPAIAARRRNPLERDPDAVAGGAKLFDQHCAECHGEMGEGTHKGPSLWVGEVQRAAPGSLFWILTNGVVRRGMPVWSKLPEPQRWQLVSYLKSLTPAEKSAP